MNSTAVGAAHGRQFPQTRRQGHCEPMPHTGALNQGVDFVYLRNILAYIVQRRTQYSSKFKSIMIGCQSFADKKRAELAFYR